MLTKAFVLSILASGSQHQLSKGSLLKIQMLRVHVLRISGGGVQSCVFCQSSSSDTDQLRSKTIDLCLILKRRPKPGREQVGVLSEEFNWRQATTRWPDGTDTEGWGSAELQVWEAERREWALGGRIHPRGGSQAEVNKVWQGEMFTWGAGG